MPSSKDEESGPIQPDSAGGSWQDWAQFSAGAAPGEGTACETPHPAEHLADPVSPRGPTLVAAGIIAGGFVIAGVLGGTIAGLLMASRDAPASSDPIGLASNSPAVTGAAAMSEEPEPEEESAPAWCESSASGQKVTGNGSGDDQTLPGAIFALQYAYYVDRDGESAARVLAPESGITAEGVQEGINSIPEGTQHCVEIILTGESTADVLVTQMAPGGAVDLFSSTITARQTDGGAWRLTSIRSGG
ncbi:hypothetical protein ONR57_08855 [Hoyosella sp. YIM 151337]|uniref:hypothetical protein n=1 Tax=Hoyosella sp. YIM 151337 TaxID=2992742 RepID=UPI002235DB14|nr:hypothetical protein [Hoyosella sp. YIM 151337]MCW4353404.1 hypothetical protein [Hoyosella sp. YIM 151337]